MSTHKYFDKICAVCVVFALLLTVVFINGEAFGVQAAAKVMGYETRLFDTTKVHTIDIVMDDWDAFLQTAQSEEYSVCAVVIDGEVYKNVGIRGKGNTSLSTVSSMDSDRYSFKIEFDQYDSTKTYHGLDKLSLNNIIQDTTYMKDYLTYQMMGSFGAAAPLCSYAYITVNGEDWGLYLAVEGVEDAFLQRNYGSNYGELYKPDSMDFGGGRGNGRDFNMEDFMNSEEFSGFTRGDSNSDSTDSAAETTSPSGGSITNFDPFSMGGGFGGRGGMGGFDMSSGTNEDGSITPPAGAQRSEAFDPSSLFEGGGFGGGFGMGSSDVKLQYIDDNPDSYSNIFDSAKTDITDADQTRLIESLKQLSDGKNIEEVVNIDSVIRYFVVHNFVVNGDSYTGSMIHNYYLYEEDGQLSMLPWDYNLAYGTFQSSDATSAVNEPIDTPASSDDLPMLDWIFASEEYTALYHQYFAEFLASTDFASMIDTTASLIAPYVEKDPTKFYSYEEFETGAATLRAFCLLREQSILGQLDGTIPATSDGQNADSSALIDASHVTISDMGTMNMGGGGFGGRGGGVEFGFGNFGQGFDTANNNTQTPPTSGSTDTQAMPSMPGGGFGQQPTVPSEQPSGNGMQQAMPERFDTANFPGGTDAASSSGSSTILLIVSVVILAAGLVFAFKFKR